MGENGNLRPDELVRLIEGVEGVVSCRVLLNNQGELLHLYILADPSAEAKQIMRDVEAVCLSQMGLRLDRSRCSITGVVEEDESDSLLTRLRPHSVQSSFCEGTLEVKVELHSREGLCYTGVASGQASLYTRQRLAALATLAALEESFGHTCRLTLEDVVVFEIGRFEGVLVAITMLTPLGEEVVVGSSLVRGDLEAAVVRAALDAVNRRIFVAS
ncbi:MAG: hypothetical protein QJR13_09295 [Bacillota bacterium]|nr:hypothetical protein [Bacillota bacterium]